MATKQQSKTPPASVKTRLIRLVHVAKRELKLTDEDYRALLAANLSAARVAAMEAGEVGQVSAKLMTVVELQRAMDAFVAAGFVVQGNPPRPAGTPPRRGDPPLTPPRRGDPPLTPPRRGDPPLTPPRRGKKKLRLSPKSRGTAASETQFAKIRALWITAYRLHIVENRYEQGINAFVRRLTKVEVLTWQDSTRERNKVIEGLKKIIERELLRLMGLDDARSPVADGALVAFQKGDWEVFHRLLNALTGGGT